MIYMSGHGSMCIYSSFQSLQLPSISLAVSQFFLPQKSKLGHFNIPKSQQCMRRFYKQVASRMPDGAQTGRREVLPTVIDGGGKVCSSSVGITKLKKGGGEWNEYL